MPATPRSVAAFLAAAVLLTRLLASPAHAAPMQQAVAPSDPVQAGAAAGRAGDATAQSLEPLLAGEFALQAGRLDDAARWYLEAARAAQDMGLAERATRIALLARDDERAAQALGLWREHGGSGASLLAAEATLAMRRGDDRAARRHLLALMRSSDQDSWRQALGVLGAGARNPDQAADLLQYLVERDAIPDQLQAWLTFGALAQRLEQPVLAERIVAEVVERFPGEPRVALLRASQLREADKPEQARAALALVEEQAARNADLRLAIAAEYDALGDLQRAEQTLARGPQDDQTYALRASLLAREDDDSALVGLYQELRRDAARPDPQRRLLLGQMAEFLERFDEALDWYRGVPGGPQRWAARLRAANVLHELERGGEAFGALRDIQSDAAAPEVARRDAYLLEANLRQQGGDAAGELNAFARGLAAFPDEPEILYARALSHERRDDIARAEADFRRILVAEPDSVAALNALGYTLADRTTRYQEALELINRARAAEPDNAAIIDSYGWVLYRLGRLDEALIELRRAFSLQKDAEIAAHLAQVLWALDRREEARRYFEEARELDPDSRALQRALENTGA
ncbi:MAG: tetratricopeptide repeat protein [Proteobacteria bacterium]|nr:tetratricopeptide repeat protein [Pseudomonadota bacterium]